MTQQVYILEDKNSGLLKVGISVDAQVRLGQVNKQFGCDAEIIGILSVQDARKTERFIHGMLEDCRVVGEWFEVTERKKGYLLAYFTEKSAPAIKPRTAAPLASKDMPAEIAERSDGGWSEIRAAIKRAMKEQGISQVGLAKELDMDRVNLTRTLSGRSGKTPDLWQKILDRLGLELYVRPKRTGKDD